jgi:hypothetical protein
VFIKRRAFLATVTGILLAPVVADADQVMPAPQGFTIVRKGGTNEWWIASTVGSVVSQATLCSAISLVYNNYAKGKQGTKIILYNIQTLRP